MGGLAGEDDGVQVVVGSVDGKSGAMRVPECAKDANKLVGGQLNASREVKLGASVGRVLDGGEDGLEDGDDGDEVH